MGFTDSKMSDLNFLPKKHTNFSIDSILLKSSASAMRALEGDQKVDLTMKTCVKFEASDLKATSCGTAMSPSSSSTSPSSLSNQRPLNRVLANPWCSRGPLMFDPKIITGAAKNLIEPATIGAVANSSATSTIGSSNEATPSVASASVPFIPLIKTEVERKVMLSAYANSSVIERNRLSINYPYPVGIFNAYAAAASLASHHHHHLQHHHHQLLQQSSSTTTAAHYPPASITSSSLFSNLYHQTEKSDENQNHIFPHTPTTSAAGSICNSAATVDSGNDGEDGPFFSFNDTSDSLLSYGAQKMSPTSLMGAFPLGSFSEFSFQCQMCDKIFGCQETLLAHEKTHKSTPRFECEECGKGFSQLRNYKYHISVHRGTKEFAAKCPECGKVFNDKGYLSSHMKIHRNKKEYVCPHCPKSFNQRVAFNMHVRIHTGVKPHKCNECGKRFSRKMLLKQHLRTHSGEKPYQCSVCGKSFADRSNMTLHHRLHSGIKPFACPICPKAFTKKHHLKTHLNYHTGYKPYKCPHPNCGQTFTQSSNMRTHAKKCQFKPPDV
ncbi:zinc finger protein 41 [Uranotaenia lowii]|uniref:zinc finger protein 41 n=1 Tax=Uranotaenia lowii TaxID=190385 RepID=UPI002478BD78|nr:zinc finger protein 41 [Uranotaenia lowii]